MEKGNLSKVLGVAAVAVAAVLAVWWFASNRGGVPADSFRSKNPLALPTVEGGTREIIQNKVNTPDKLAANLPANVAVPSAVVPMGQTQALRDFSVTGQNGKYVPDTLVANDGDVITVSFTASDANYNMFFPDFGVYQTVKRGETKKFQFQVFPFGQYQFYCKDVCASQMRGTLVVNKG